MIKINDISLVILIFAFLLILLSFLNILSTSFSDILSYLMIAVGLILVYSEIIRQNRVLIFLGSIIFMVGIFFLITENFYVELNPNMSVPIILIFAGSGLLLVHITTSTKNIFLITSVILLSVGLTLLLVGSHWKVGLFINSVLPVINYIWPVVLVAIIIILLLRIK